MFQRTYIEATGRRIRIGGYTLYLDVKMRIDEFASKETGEGTEDFASDETRIVATIDRVKVTQIFDRVKRKDIDKVYQPPFFHE
jgi:hypothetical protein